MNQPLGYAGIQNFSYDEVKARLNSARKKLREVKKHYSLIDMIFIRRMRDKDIEALLEGASMLMPLILQESLSLGAGIAYRGIHKKGEPSYEISRLHGDILTYMSKFKNSGVTRHIGGVGSLD